MVQWLRFHNFHCSGVWVQSHVLHSLAKYTKIKQLLIKIVFFKFCSAVIKTTLPILVLTSVNNRHSVQGLPCPTAWSLDMFMSL